MRYTKLGNTGLEVSKLGFGAMRLPMIGEGPDAKVNDELAVPMIHRGFELGINYIDTAVMYCNHDGQRAVGKALKGWRDKVIVSTKNHYTGEDEDEWWQNLEDSLRLLDVDYIDVYNHHGMNEKNFFEQVLPRVSKWMMKAKDQGLVRHVCISFHDGSEALKKIIDAEYAEAITLQYNILDRQLEEGIAYAHEKGVGIVVMGPVGGGRLGEPSEILANMVEGVKRVPELALRFVLANPNVDICLSGLDTIEHVEENCAIASDSVSLTEDDKAAIDKHLERLRTMAELYCTGCGYCVPCAQGVNIPHIFGLYNLGRVYGIWDRPRRMYKRMLEEQRENNQPYTACTDCGKCEEKCPQNIQIRKQLKEAHEALTAA